MLTTIIDRPYVFIFLISFLILGRICWGWRKTTIWLVIGYVIAWASELSSIHNGFPYGLYHYIYGNMPGELMVFGVPFWDSLSYPFMIFAGYTTAQFLCRNPNIQYPMPNNWKSGIGNWGFKMKVAVLGAFLTMLLDIIIDPLTVLGDKWFLGRIYYYPNGGEYFGVPITNFLGWFLVPLIVILIFNVIPAKAGISFNKHKINEIPPPWRTEMTYQLKHFLNPLFYISIALFNIIITIYIGEPLLASIDCILIIPVVWFMIQRVNKDKAIIRGL